LLLLARFACFQYHLAGLPQHFGGRLLEQRQAALHHAGPIGGHAHHSPLVIKANQLPLLRQQHARGWELQAGQDLLPEAVEIEIGGCGGGGWSSLGRWCCAGCWGRGCCRLSCRSGHRNGCGSRRRRSSGRGWRRSWSRCLGHRSWSCCDGRGLRFSQQAQQQHLKPQPGLSALAQLHFAAA
jgi:hypothetical protein